MALVKRQTDALLAQAAVPARLGDDVTELLVTTFHEVRPGDLVQSLVGTALKDEPEDLGVLRRYFEQVVRSRSGEHWREYYEARRHLD